MRDVAEESPAGIDGPIELGRGPRGPARRAAASRTIPP